MEKGKREPEIGDAVRSFDFISRDLEGEKACYVEGVIEDIGNLPEGVEVCGCPNHYHIRVSRQVFQGEEINDLVGDLVYPKINGEKGLFGEKSNGVEVIEPGSKPTSTETRDLANKTLN